MMMGQGASVMLVESRRYMINIINSRQHPAIIIMKYINYIALALFDDARQKEAHKNLLRAAR